LQLLLMFEPNDTKKARRSGCSVGWRSEIGEDQYAEIRDISCGVVRRRLVIGRTARFK